jgi:hypothetical protein
MSDRYDFRAYAVGLCSASVCTSLSNEDATARLNGQEPTGIDSQWQISSDPTFASGQTNPRPCDDWPDTHRHILFNC